MCERERQTGTAAELTAGAVGPSPAWLTLTGVGGHTTAMHTFLSTVGYSENKRESDRVSVLL